MLLLLSDPPPPAATVNKRELAKALRVSLPTISALLERYPDFPVERAGTNGLEWQFDLPAVASFVHAQRDAEAADKAERDELLATLVLPFEPPAQQDGAKLSIKDQLDAAKLRDALRREAVAAGELVNAAAVEDRYASIFTAWNRELHAFVRQLGREQRWPEPILRDVESRLDGLQERLVNEAPDC